LSAFACRIAVRPALVSLSRSVARPAFVNRTLPEAMSTGLRAAAVVALFGALGE
jgi:hypothetical protein